MNANKNIYWLISNVKSKLNLIWILYKILFFFNDFIYLNIIEYYNEYSILLVLSYYNKII